MQNQKEISKMLLLLITQTVAYCHGMFIRMCKDDIEMLKIVCRGAFAILLNAINNYRIIEPNIILNDIFNKQNIAIMSVIMLCDNADESVKKTGCEKCINFNEEKLNNLIAINKQRGGAVAKNIITCSKFIPKCTDLIQGGN